MNDEDIKCLVSVYCISGSDVYSAVGNSTKPSSAVDFCLETWRYENGDMDPTKFSIEISDCDDNVLYQGVHPFESWKRLASIVEGGWKELVHSSGTFRFGRCHTPHPGTHPFNTSTERDRHLHCTMVPTREK